MKSLFSALFLALCLCALVVQPVSAGIYTTNIISYSAVSAGTNTSVSFVPPQSHTINAQQVQVYHSAAANTNFPTYVISRISFDGGVTWANISSNNCTTNLNDYFSISMTGAGATNQVLVVTTTNQTVNVNNSWQN